MVYAKMANCMFELEDRIRYNEDVKLNSKFNLLYLLVIPHRTCYYLDNRELYIEKYLLYYVKNVAEARSIKNENLLLVLARGDISC